MIGAILKAGAVAGAVKEIENTDTGKFVLGVAKVTVITVIVITVITSIIIIRKMNNTFSATKRDINSLKIQTQEINNEISQNNLRNV